MRTLYSGSKYWDLLTVVLLLSQPSFAELKTSELLSLNLEELSEVNVVTATRREQKIADVPATVYSVSAEKIIQRGYRNLVQLLEDIPEVEVNARGFVESYNLVTVRGVSGVEKNFVIMQDGVRIYAITGSPEAFHWNYPLFQAKKVEVVLGPTSAIYGADATDGVINIITQDAKDLNGGNLTASGGMYSTTDDSFIYGHQFGQIKVVAYGSFFSSAEPYFPNLYPSDYAWYNDQYRTNGQMHTLSGGTTTVPILDYSTTTRAYAVGAKVTFRDFELGYWRNYGAHSASLGDRPDKGLYVDEASLESVIESLYARYTYTPEGENWSLKTEMVKGAQGILPGSAFKNINTNYQTRYLYEVDNSIAFISELTYVFPDQTHLITGINYTDFSTLPRASGFPGPYDPTKGTGSQGYQYPGTNIDIDYYSLWYQNFGLYAQLQRQFGSKLQLTLGARYDYNSRYAGSFNPRVGAVYEFNPQLKGKILYAEAFRAPPPWLAYASFGSFTVSGGVPTGGVFNIPNPDLKPEKLRSVETSLIFKASDSIFVTVDAFGNIVTDLFFTRDPLPPGTTFHGVPITGTRPINKGVLHSYGTTLKLDATRQTDYGFFNPFIAYSYITGDLDSGSLVNAASHTIKGALDFTKGHILISPQFQFRSRSMVPNTADVRTPSYVVVNLAARYQNLFNSKRYKTDAFINIRNLFDRRYYNANVDNGRALGLTPQDPIRIEGGASLEF